MRHVRLHPITWIGLCGHGKLVVRLRPVTRLSQEEEAVGSIIGVMLAKGVLLRLLLLRFRLHVCGLGYLLGRLQRRRMKLMVEL